MLDIVLNVLSILGIALLVLLGILLVLILLVLFFPVSYRIAGKKTAEEFTASFKANWLFGVLRACFFHPEPGKLIVKLLWFTVYDSETSDEKDGKDDKDNKAVKAEKAEKSEKAEAAKQTEESAKADENNTAKETERAVESKTSDQDAVLSTEDNGENINTDSDDNVNNDAAEDSPRKGIIGFITAKYEKIKYTIIKIYDKIKHILENIDFYKKLYQDEQTQGLLKHAGKRLGKIWKNIHPRKLKADIVFGTGSPDTTGYAMGIYGMLSPKLGKNVVVTPDFTETVFKGDFYAAGHITIFQVVLHVLLVLTDKRLKLLIHRIKKHNGQEV